MLPKIGPELAQNYYVRMRILHFFSRGPAAQQCETGTGKQETRTTEADTDHNTVFPIFSKKKKKTAQLRNPQSEKS
jgi:hypothetical protein